MKKIKEQTIDRLKSVIKIEEVVSDYLSLKKRGVNYIGLCPFHDEKTPSFTISPVKGIYKCFGCGVSGDAITFVIEYNKVGYKEAIEQLCKKYGIYVEYDEKEKNENNTINNNDSKIVNSVYSDKEVLEIASKYFQYNLYNTEEGKTKGLNYLYSRGLNDEQIKELGIGYSLSDNKKLVELFTSKGISGEQLVKVGLCYSKEDGKYDIEHIRDRYSGRVIFPIYNISNDVIGFGGRIIEKNDKLAKYINTPQTDIYDKSRVLYGLNFSKRDIAKKDYAFLVEGYMDFIAFYKRGIKNVIATCGTSLTEQQVKQIHRFTDNVVICYDGDSAGIKAMERAIELFFSEGMNVKIVLFPENEDPDSFVSKNDINAVIGYIKQNKFDFVDYISNKINSASEQHIKSDLIDYAVKVIAKNIKDVDRVIMIKKLSEKIGIRDYILSKMVGNIRKNEFYKNNRNNVKNSNNEKPNDNDKDSKYEAEERDIIEFVIDKGRYIITETFSTSSGQMVIKEITIAEYFYHILKNKDIVDVSLFNTLNNFVSFIEKNFNKNYIPDRNDYISCEYEYLSLIANDMAKMENNILSNKWNEIIKDTNIFNQPDTEENIKKHIKKLLVSLKIKELEIRKTNTIKEKLPQKDNNILKDTNGIDILEIVQNIDNEINKFNKVLGRDCETFCIEFGVV